METDRDTSFERILSNRQVPPPGDDLSQRIISAALEIPQRKPMSFVVWFSGLFAGQPMVLRPAYSMLAMLLVGFMIGLWGAEEITIENDYAEADDEVSIQEFLYASDYTGAL